MNDRIFPDGIRLPRRGHFSVDRHLFLLKRAQVLVAGAVDRSPDFPERFYREKTMAPRNNHMAEECLHVDRMGGGYVTSWRNTKYDLVLRRESDSRVETKKSLASSYL